MVDYIYDPIYEAVDRDTGQVLFSARITVLGHILKLHPDAMSRIKRQAHPDDAGGGSISNRLPGLCDLHVNFMGAKCLLVRRAG